VEALRVQRDRLLAELPALGCPAVPSDANFVLFRVPGDQRQFWEALLSRGVLVRDVGLTGWLRVTAGTPEEMDAFLSELGKLMQRSDSETTAMGAA